MKKVMYIMVLVAGLLSLNSCMSMLGFIELNPSPSYTDSKSEITYQVPWTGIYEFVISQTVGGIKYYYNAPKGYRFYYVIISTKNLNTEKTIDINSITLTLAGKPKEKYLPAYGNAQNHDGLYISQALSENPSVDGKKLPFELLVPKSKYSWISLYYLIPRDQKAASISIFGNTFNLETGEKESIAQAQFIDS